MVKIKKKIPISENNVKKIKKREYNANQQAYYDIKNIQKNLLLIK